MKKKIVIIALALLILVGGVYFIIKASHVPVYEIKVELVDEKSPDRILVVLKDGKEFKDYKYIKYTDGVILCQQKNPTVNVFEIEDELIIVLTDDSEVTANLVKEVN